MWGSVCPLTCPSLYIFLFIFIKIKFIHCEMHISMMSFNELEYIYTQQTPLQLSYSTWRHPRMFPHTFFPSTITRTWPLLLIFVRTEWSFCLLQLYSIIYYALFVWLPSLNMIFFEIYPGCVSLSCPYLLLIHILLYENVSNDLFFSCSCMDIWDFSIVSYLKSCYEHSCISCFVEMFSYILSKYPEVELLGYVVCKCPTLN